MASQCRLFEANHFDKTRCKNCYKVKAQHSNHALHDAQALRKVVLCGFLFIAPPNLSFSDPSHRQRRWQRRFFVLYDDGELTYAVDDGLHTLPQGVIDLTGGIEITPADDLTGQSYAICLTTHLPIGDGCDELSHESDGGGQWFLRAGSRDELKRWCELLQTYCTSRSPQRGEGNRLGTPRRSKSHAASRATPLSGSLTRSATTTSPTPDPGSPVHIACHPESLGGVSSAAMQDNTDASSSSDVDADGPMPPANSQPSVCSPPPAHRNQYRSIRRQQQQQHDPSPNPAAVPVISSTGLRSTCGTHSQPLSRSTLKLLTNGASNKVTNGDGLSPEHGFLSPGTGSPTAAFDPKCPSPTMSSMPVARRPAFVRCNRVPESTGVFGSRQQHQAYEQQAAATSPLVSDSRTRDRSPVRCGDIGSGGATSSEVREGEIGMYIKKGWLHRPRPGDKDMERYYCILQDGRLDFYTDLAAATERPDHPALRIDLTNCVGLRPADTREHYGINLLLVPGGCVFLGAMTTGIRNNWLEALRLAVGHISNPQQSADPLLVVTGTKAPEVQPGDSGAASASGAIVHQHHRHHHHHSQPPQQQQPYRVLGGGTHTTVGAEQHKRHSTGDGAVPPTSGLDSCDAEVDHILTNKLHESRQSKESLFLSGSFEALSHPIPAPVPASSTAAATAASGAEPGSLLLPHPSGAAAAADPPALSTQKHLEDEISRRTAEVVLLKRQLAERERMQLEAVERETRRIEEALSSSEEERARLEFRVDQLVADLERSEEDKLALAEAIDQCRRCSAAKGSYTSTNDASTQSNDCPPIPSANAELERLRTREAELERSVGELRSQLVASDRHTTKLNTRHEAALSTADAEHAHLLSRCQDLERVRDQMSAQCTSLEHQLSGERSRGASQLAASEQENVELLGRCRQAEERARIAGEAAEKFRSLVTRLHKLPWPANLADSTDDPAALVETLLVTLQGQQQVLGTIDLRLADLLRGRNGAPPSSSTIPIGQRLINWIDELDERIRCLQQTASSLAVKEDGHRRRSGGNEDVMRIADEIRQMDSKNGSSLVWNEGIGLSELIESWDQFAQMYIKYRALVRRLLSNSPAARDPQLQLDKLAAAVVDILTGDNENSPNLAKTAAPLPFCPQCLRLAVAALGSRDQEFQRISSHLETHATTLLASLLNQPRLMDQLQSALSVLPLGKERSPTEFVCRVLTELVRQRFQQQPDVELASLQPEITEAQLRTQVELDCSRLLEHLTPDESNSTPSDFGFCLDALVSHAIPLIALLNLLASSQMTGTSAVEYARCSTSSSNKTIAVNTDLSISMEDEALDRRLSEEMKKELGNLKAQLDRSDEAKTIVLRKEIAHLQEHSQQQWAAMKSELEQQRLRNLHQLTAELNTIRRHQSRDSSLTNGTQTDAPPSGVDVGCQAVRDWSSESGDRLWEVFDRVDADREQWCQRRLDQLQQSQAASLEEEAAATRAAIKAMRTHYEAQLADRHGQMELARREARSQLVALWRTVEALNYQRSTVGVQIHSDLSTVIDRLRKLIIQSESPDDVNLICERCSQRLVLDGAVQADPTTTEAETRSLTLGIPLTDCPPSPSDATGLTPEADTNKQRSLHSTSSDTQRGSKKTRVYPTSRAGEAGSGTRTIPHTRGGYSQHSTRGRGVGQSGTHTGSQHPQQRRA